MDGSTDGATETAWHAAVPRSWEKYFAVCLVGVVLFTYTEGDEPTRERIVALGLLVVMTIWYVVVGRPVIAGPVPGWRGWLFQGVLLALFVGAVGLVGPASFLLFALCPLVYMTLAIWPAHVVVAAYAFTPAMTALVRQGPESLTVTLPLGAIVTAISVVTALTTEKIERTSQERAVLIEELASTRAEVAQLSRDAGIAHERQRLAGDIHDTVAQGLSSVVMLVEAADAILTRDPDAARTYLSLAARTARENLDETRAIVAALTPTPLVEATLVDALRRLAARFDEETGVTATVRTAGEPRALPTGTEVVLLRVAQEALNNVRKHAAASAVTIVVDYGTGYTSVEIVDDGSGFDVSALAPGYGLGAMRARVEQIGGQLTITSTLGAGTAVRTRVPS